MEFVQDALFPKTAYQKKKEEKETEDALKQSHQSSILEAERALFWSSNVNFDSQQGAS